ncbi:hypothetical protein MIZ01_0212 [Sideroxyarcus emersonii]|uniref:Uncharacterized protein n=1 Tax=Sideroxyarcus emersonii TaxID=2764705 RepID=A0AAN1X7K5_9PROT|nr:hypothetical protein MIZ01_0212 [Sideroxyarcus emersonii]
MATKERSIQLYDPAVSLLLPNRRAISCQLTGMKAASCSNVAA